MTPEQFRQKMLDIYGGGPDRLRPGLDYDLESTHSSADNLMCELLRSLGYGAGVEVFRQADKWYA